MKRVLFFLSFTIILSIIACGDSDDPIGPSPGNDSEFYPLAVGNTWLYDCSGTINAGGIEVGTITGKTETEITGIETHSEGFDVYVQENTVTDTTVISGQTFITDSTFTDYIRITDSGFYGYPHLTDTDSSYMVPFPLESGSNWVFADEPPTTGEILTMSASVLTIAGYFENCMEMRTIWTDSTISGIVMNTSDFARNVGRVKNVLSITAGTATTTYVHELETYSLN